jgi:hypothetical protein
LVFPVGWLERGQPYARGEVPEPFKARLFELLVDPWAPAVAAGYHTCDLCRFTGKVRNLTYKGVTIDVGASNLYVPGHGRLYYAPSLIAHYVDAHEYAPPEEFQTAVLNCPKMRSMDYLKALSRIAPANLLKGGG